MDQLHAALTQAELNLSYTNIRTPIAGRIGRSLYSVGNFIGPSSNALATVVSQDPIYVTFPRCSGNSCAREKLGNSGKLGDQVNSAVVLVQLADGTRYPQPGRSISSTLRSIRALTRCPSGRPFPTPSAS